MYDADPVSRAMLVEDVGETSLLDAVRRSGADAADLFRLAATELIRLHVEGTAKIDSTMHRARDFLQRPTLRMGA